MFGPASAPDIEWDCLICTGIYPRDPDCQVPSTLLRVGMAHHPWLWHSHVSGPHTWQLSNQTLVYTGDVLKQQQVPSGERNHKSEYFMCGEVVWSLMSPKSAFTTTKDNVVHLDWDTGQYFLIQRQVSQISIHLLQRERDKNCFCNNPSPSMTP